MLIALLVLLAFSNPVRTMAFHSPGCISTQKAAPWTPEKIKLDTVCLENTLKLDPIQFPAKEGWLDKSCLGNFQRNVIWVPAKFEMKAYRVMENSEKFLEVSIAREDGSECGTHVFSLDPTKPTRKLTFPLSCHESRGTPKFKSLRDLGVKWVQYLKSNKESPTACFSFTENSLFSPRLAPHKPIGCGCLDFERLDLYLKKDSNKIKFGIHAGKVVPIRPISCIDPTSLHELSERYGYSASNYNELIKNHNIRMEASPILVQIENGLKQVKIMYLSRWGDLTNETFHAIYNINGKDIEKEDPGANPEKNIHVDNVPKDDLSTKENKKVECEAIESEIIGRYERFYDHLKSTGPDYWLRSESPLLYKLREKFETHCTDAELDEFSDRANTIREISDRSIDAMYEPTPEVKEFSETFLDTVRNLDLNYPVLASAEFYALIKRGEDLYLRQYQSNGIEACHSYSTDLVAEGIKKRINIEFCPADRNTIVKLDNDIVLGTPN